VPVKTTSRSQNQASDFLESSKGLNLREDSNRRRAVIFLAVAQNKFINCLRLSAAGLDFSTADRRYADK
jgi:hypothetical protein